MNPFMRSRGRQQRCSWLVGENYSMDSNMKSIRKQVNQGALYKCFACHMFYRLQSYIFMRLLYMCHCWSGKPHISSMFLIVFFTVTHLIVVRGPSKHKCLLWVLFLAQPEDVLNKNHPSFRVFFISFYLFIIQLWPSCPSCSIMFVMFMFTYLLYWLCLSQGL